MLILFRFNFPFFGNSLLQKKTPLEGSRTMSKNHTHVTVLGIIFAAAVQFIGIAHADQVSAKLTAEIAKVTTNYPSGYKASISTVFTSEARNVMDKITYTDNQGQELEYTIEEIRKGVVLLHSLGKDLVRLKGSDFQADRGGPLNLVFYRTFFGGDIRQAEFEFAPEGEAAWNAYTHDTGNRDHFDGLNITIYKKIGIPSGISKVSLAMGETTVRDYNPTELPAATDSLLDSIWTGPGAVWFPGL